MTELVTRRDEGRVAVLTLNRPEALNALSPPLYIELRGHIERLEREGEAIGAVVVTGAGRSFSAGNDLKGIAAGQHPPSPYYQAETLEKLEALPQAVIAAVRGHCYTGALELAIACDFILAADTARFCDTHGKYSMVPTWGMTVRLPRRVGVPKAREIMFTGRVIDGAEAVQIGLADRCVPDEQLERQAVELGRQIAANSPWTIAHEKALLRQAAELPYREALRAEREQGPGRGPDSQARIQQLFMQRR